MPAAESLRDQQFTLATHIRDPRQPPPPGIEDRRLAIYRDLFYNSLEGLLAGNFPVIGKLLGNEGWHVLVRAFYRDFRCSTPLFPELPREFIQYLQQRAADGADDPAWLPELAHYEWVELALELSEAHPDDAPHDPAGDLVEGVPVLSPLAWPLAYAWPVHRLAPGHLPDAAPATATFLLVQRDARHKVRFNELSALAFHLLHRLSERPGPTGRQHLESLALEAGAPDTEAFIASGRSMLEQFRAAGIVPGTRLPGGNAE